MPRSNFREFTMDYLRIVPLSMLVGGGVGALLGTFAFPVLGTVGGAIAGFGIGGAVGAGITIYRDRRRNVVRPFSDISQAPITDQNPIEFDPQKHPVVVRLSNISVPVSDAKIGIPLEVDESQAASLHNMTGITIAPGKHNISRGHGSTVVGVAIGKIETTANNDGMQIRYDDNFTVQQPRNLQSKLQSKLAEHLESLTNVQATANTTTVPQSPTQSSISPPLTIPGQISTESQQLPSSPTTPSSPATPSRMRK